MPELFELPELSGQAPPRIRPGLQQAAAAAQSRNPGRGQRARRGRMQQPRSNSRDAVQGRVIVEARGGCERPMAAVDRKKRAKSGENADNCKRKVRKSEQK